MSQRWDYPPVLQLREKARGEPDLSSKLNQSHGTLQPEAPYFLSHTFSFDQSIYDFLIDRIEGVIGLLTFGHGLHANRARGSLRGLSILSFSASV
jgi:hypothetical protein